MSIVKAIRNTMMKGVSALVAALLLSVGFIAPAYADDELGTDTTDSSIVTEATPLNEEVTSETTDPATEEDSAEVVTGPPLLTEVEKTPEAQPDEATSKKDDTSGGDPQGPPANPTDGVDPQTTDGADPQTTDNTNSPAYWEQLYSDRQLSCYKSEDVSDYGMVTNGGKAVTLSGFDQSWAGTYWEVLIVKGGSVDIGDGPGNLVYEDLSAGTAYYAPLNAGEQQSDVSHWIVCGNTTPKPVEPACVLSPVFSYTFLKATGSGVITVTGGEEGEALCAPLYNRAASWKYDLPASGSPSWSQTLFGFNDTTVGTIGSFPFGPPQLDGCHQYDVYASFVGYSELTLPDKLLGPNNPYEPAFLHDVLAGKGPNPTYSHTSSEGCNPPTPVVKPANPDHETEKACYPSGELAGGIIRLYFTNPVELADGETAANAVSTITDENGVIQTVSVAANDSKYVEFLYPLNSGDHIVTFTTEGVEGVITVTVNTDCESVVEVVPPPIQVQELCLGGIVPPGVLKTDTGVLPGDEEAGGTYRIRTYELESYGTFTKIDTSVDGVNKVVVNYVPFDESTVFVPSSDESYYVIDSEVGQYVTWVYTYKDEECVTTPPTEPPVTNPPVTPPTVGVPPATPPMAAIPAGILPAPLLAYTGVVLPIALITMSVLALLTGIAAVLLGRRRSRKDFAAGTI